MGRSEILEPVGGRAVFEVRRFFAALGRCCRRAANVLPAGIKAAINRPTPKSAAFVAAGLLLWLAGCGPAAQPPAAGPLLVGVSILPQAWLVKAVGGPQVETVTLVAPGDNPHTYQPTDDQVSRLMRAAVYFRLGVPFESGPWFQALQSSGRVRIVDLRQGITLRAMEEHDTQGSPASAGGRDEAVEGKDPHIWLSPRLLKIQAGTVARTLMELDPSHADVYRQGLQKLQSQLDELDREISRRLAPYRGRAFFVFHPAWGYFAADYGLKQVAVEVEGKEPSDRELTEIQRLARASGVKAVIVQPQIYGSAARAVAAAAGGRVETVDALSGDPPAEFRRMAEVLQRALR